MLYLVATPIGNLSEITNRAIEILNSAEYILCEDTRTSLTLLNNYNIKKKLVSYHKFNEKSMCDKILEDLKIGKEIALISDAGMPGISDPGSVLVNACHKEKLPVTVVSGASALINAFVLSGFEPPFTFIGFLPTKNSEISKLLSSFKDVDSCLIFYVSPHDIDNFYSKMIEFFPNRNSCVVREISKKFEEVTFVDAKERFNGVLKGEFVVIFNKPTKEQKQLNDEEIDTEIINMLKESKSKTEISKMISKKYNLNKNEIYKKVVDLSENK